MKTFENSTGDRNAGAGRLRAAVARTLALFAITGFVGMIAAGCGEDSVTPPPAGFEAQGLVLRVNAADTVVDSSGVRGSLSVMENDLTAEISLLFIAKSDAKRTVPTGSEYKLAWSVADTTIASIESASSWSFKVRGRKAGSTTATLKLMNGTATIFTSSSIAITVTAAASGLHVGDTATFNFVDRDTTNKNVSGTEKTKVWTVMREDLSIYGRTKVTEVLEVTYDAAGTAELERDTLYLQFAGDGSVYEYDMLRRLLVRVSGGDAFGSSLPPYWVKVTNTSAASASAWTSVVNNSNAAVDSIRVDNVSAPGIPAAMNVVFKMTAMHEGTVATTVPAGSYPAAVRTNHTLRLNVKLASFPITVLDNALLLTSNASAKDGLLHQTFEGKMLEAKALTVTQPLPVTGFEMELKSIKRK
jgi:hypothetical protein